MTWICGGDAKKYAKVSASCTRVGVSAAGETTPLLRPLARYFDEA